MKKKYTTLVIIGIIMILGVLIYFGYNTVSQSVFQPRLSTLNAISVDLIDYDESNGIYRFYWSVEEPFLEGNCNEYSERNFDFIVTGDTGNINSQDLPKYVEELPLGKEFEAYEVQISGFSAKAGMCSGKERTVEARVESLESHCKIDRVELHHGVNRAIITCRFTGTVKAYENNNQVSAQFTGLQAGESWVEMSSKDDGGDNGGGDGNGDDGKNSLKIELLVIIIILIILIIATISLYKKYKRRKRR